MFRNLIKKAIASFLFYFWILLGSQLSLTNPAQAASQHFQWQGAKNYTVTGDYINKKTSQNSLIHEQGKRETNQLEYLQIKFYDPAGKLVYEHADITNSIGQGKFFELNLDPKTQTLLGKIDLGGENPGELFLKGEVDQGLSLIKIDANGEEQILDSDR